MSRKETFNLIEGCILQKSKTDCDPTKCYRCGWNEKEIARRKEKINRGLVIVKNNKNMPIYGIKVNETQKRGRKNAK